MYLFFTVLSPYVWLHIKHYILAAWSILLILHSALVEKQARSLYAVGIGILVAVVDHTLYT
jgi:hypothetical protein